MRYWVVKDKNDVSAKEIFNFLFSLPCKMKAKKQIDRIEMSATKEYYICYFKNKMIGKLFYPIEMNIGLLYRAISEILYSEDWHFYLAPETSFSSSDIVLDCGAGEGLFSLIASAKCRKVYAIEPMSLFVRALKETFAGVSNVEIIEKAVGNMTGETFIEEKGMSSKITNDKGTIVKMDTIDNLFYCKDIPISFIKGDLEGYEIDALKGAQRLIRKYRPKIAITTYHGYDDAEKIKEIILNADKKYHIRTKGIEYMTGGPTMLHAWPKLA